jgi:arylsulfatase A-like enzyme
MEAPMPLRATGFLATALLLACSAAAAPVPADDRPHIVVILADDLGNADLGYRGGQIRTPNLDGLARGGVRLESYYGLPVCTPARAALMTGRHPMRHGLQTFVIFPAHTYGLPLDERTLPQALRETGYRTAMVGKWHLGHADRKYWPQNRGFDHFYGNVVGEVDYFTKERGGAVDWQRNGTVLREEGYHTTQIGDEAVRLVEGHDPATPLFLYVAALAPHTPLQVPKADLDAYAGVFEDPELRTYAAMITHLDLQVGRILAALEKKGMRGNTLVFFSADNGGRTGGKFKPPGGTVAVKPPASNGVFRDGKGSLYEGGVRVPALMNWPARLKPGVRDEPMHHIDLMPTLLGRAGGKADPAKPFDGRDLWPSLAEGKSLGREELLINVELHRGAIRKGKWKLVKLALLPGSTELFDLSADPGETTNLAERFPDVVKDLEAALLRHAREQAPSLWMKAQPSFIGVQGKNAFEPGFDPEDGGAPGEAAALPAR